MIDPHDIASNLIDAADCFASCLFHRIRDGRPIVGKGEDADYTLPVEILPTRQHREVVQILMAHLERGVPLTVDSVRRVSVRLGHFAAEKVLNPFNRDLIDDLPVICGSGAHLHFYAREIIRLDRKRKQLERLRAVLARYDGETVVQNSAQPMRKVGKPARPIRRRPRIEVVA